MDIVGIGTSCVDLLANIPKLPEANRGTRLKDFSWQGGGKVPSALVASARLGSKCGIIGLVGDCSYGQFCIDDFKYHGIDVSNMKMEEGKETPFSIVLADDYSHGRSIIYYPGTVRSPSLEDLDKDYIQSAKYLHLSDVSEVTIQAAKWAREKNIPVAFDADGYHESVEDMIPLIDIFIPSEFYYKTVYNDENYEANCRDIQSRGPDIVVFTLGERGCVGVEGDEYFVESGFKVDVVDTTGAGDVYHGAFLSALLEGMTAKEAARFSNAVSAIKCTRIGGRAGVPSFDVTMKFLETGIIDYEDIDKRVARYRKPPR